MNIRYIDEKEYDSLEIYSLFEKSVFSRRFAVLHSDFYEFKMSWRSDLLTPEIVEICSNYAAIGIDNDFAILEEKTLNVILKFKLSWNFLKTICIGKITYIISEQEVLLLNTSDWTILKHQVLPDLIENWNIKDGKLEILCMDTRSYLL